MTSVKVCNNCNKEKVSSDFRVYSHGRGGNVCKKCTAERIKEWRASDVGKAKRAAERARWSERQAKKSGNEYISKDDRIKAAAIKKEAVLLAKAEKKMKEKQTPKKAWQANGLSSAEVWRIRYRTDPEFNLKERVRRQLIKKAKGDGVADLVRQAINRGGKSPKAHKLLGWTIAELKGHLEARFKDGMSWSNMPKWHIDHIKPQRLFNLQNNGDLKACWALDNLQPLWAKDNIRKGGKYYD